MIVKKSRTCSIFVIYSYLKHSGFPAVKEDAKYVERGAIFQ